jgi:hypothetical protein
VRTRYRNTPWTKELMNTDIDTKCNLAVYLLTNALAQLDFGNSSAAREQLLHSLKQLEELKALDKKQKPPVKGGSEESKLG